MSKRSLFSLPAFPWIVGALLLAVPMLAPACGGSTSTTSGTGGRGGADTTTSSADTTTSATTSSAGGSTVTSSSGTGGAPGCMANTDCTDKTKPICDVVSGDCVACLPTQDICASGQYCTPSNTCMVGCTDASDCMAGGQSLFCDTSTNQCVGCIADADCPPGSVCGAGMACTPGCSAMQGCAGMDTCCTDTCFDLQTNTHHCGDCAINCFVPDQAKVTCIAGMCGYTCNQGFLDCNLDPADGCEHNGLQDGPCSCSPGSTQSCYTGAPGTKDVGTCKGGTQTCDVSGAFWGPCTSQVIPIPEKCNGLDDDCDGAPEPAGCVACTAGTGSCNGTVGTYCPDGLSVLVENCDPLEGMTCNPANGQCLGVCSKGNLGSSYLGCDYFPTVTANLVDPQFHFAVAVSNTSGSNASVTVTKGAATLQVVTVAPNSVQIITLPWELTLKGPSSGSVVPFPQSVLVQQGAYRVRSTQPVSVYQFSPLEYTLNGAFSYSNDASILLPTNVWTGTYRVAARHHFAGGSGFYTVTASTDGTVVNVTGGPNGGTVKTGIPGINGNGSGSVTLNSGDVIEVVTNGGVSLSDPNDVTGTLVSASKPVQVIGGHSCIYIPDNTGYCDHLEESMFPFETLSTAYIISAPLITGGGNVPKVEMVRIIATKANTSLTYDPPQAGAPTFIAQAGAWVEIADTNHDFQITASDPILVAQYMEGQAAGGNTGDPAMTLAVAKDQYRKNYLLHAPTNYEANFVNITAPTGAVVTLDGAAVPGFVAIGGTGFSLARAQLSNAGSGNHTMVSSQAFGISVYGYGQYTSYWYPGGSELTKLHN